MRPEHLAQLVERARSIVDQEIGAMAQLRDSFDDSLIKAVGLIQACPGRLIGTGVGKSGHIGAKLAATFASTGTPSFFLHAAEASHGDLGMITAQDVVLAISNSGMTKELFPVVDFCSANGVKVICMTANDQSRLAQGADICLRLPRVNEVCPNNLAPTSSAVITLAAGHVLAVLLMEQRSFVDSDFGKLHPGGRLGLLLSSVRRYTDEFKDAVPMVAPHELLGHVVIKLAEGQRGCVVVTEEGTNRLLGLITEGDLRRAFSPDMFSKTAQAIMTTRPVTVSVEDLMSTAVSLMKERRIANVVVVDGDTVVDVLHTKDLMQRGYM
ncbi:KpsF/GutQ family sugar-phosphate isomerase [Hyphomicrobium sp.]|uniref:KpsF/GutQ family sugar-phosphate isomerase n=1 Tax=Hyphomicrobium sp. TaxID=82 RepID=UPI0025BD0075|nr:KpsF/GutQ family sugar-phosphate isomerase [Hyphomicrobium sp.]MCC7251390.1 KpsF/GutQ family sugar-phosphate isomerase [Hyphomicrobium sp.]